MTEPARRSLIVDTSAAVAVILAEPGSEELAAHLEDALVRLMSAAIRVELGIVIEARLRPAGQDVVDRFLRDAKVDIVPVDADLADRAMSGWRRYGKGRHPAGLNFGDCFTYALADRTGHPVLCTGNDFAATDITVVRPETEQTGRPVSLPITGRIMSTHADLRVRLVVEQTSQQAEGPFRVARLPRSARPGQPELEPGSFADRLGAGEGARVGGGDAAAMARPSPLPSVPPG